MAVDGHWQDVFLLEWEPTDEQIRRCWADNEVATEHGAYGIAVLLVTELTGLTVVERSRKGTGFDYWLGPRDSAGPLFQQRERLEVSGIRRGTDAAVRSRLREKLDRLQRYGQSPPAIVIVVEFGTPRSKAVRL